LGAVRRQGESSCWGVCSWPFLCASAPARGDGRWTAPVSAPPLPRGLLVSPPHAPVRATELGPSGLDLGDTEQVSAGEAPAQAASARHRVMQPDVHRVQQCPVASVLSRNSSGSRDAPTASRVVFSPLVHTPALRGTEDGEVRRTRAGRGRSAGDRHRCAAAVPSATELRAFAPSRGGSWSRGHSAIPDSPAQPVPGRQPTSSPPSSACRFCHSLSAVARLLWRGHPEVTPRV
jgi:hypothetical protein